MDIFWGKVQKGDKRGRELGYPTANMRLHKKFAEGVYVSVVRIHDFKNVIPAKAGIQKQRSLGKLGMTEGQWSPSVTFIGSAKTFGKKDYKAETWIMDFDSNLYGKFVTVKLLKKLRNNQKFESAESLIKQMKEDEKIGRKFFASSSLRTPHGC